MEMGSIVYRSGVIAIKSTFRQSIYSAHKCIHAICSATSI